MPPRKKPTTVAATSSVTGESASSSTNKGPAPRLAPMPESTLPKTLRFPLVVLISLSIAAVANTLASEFTQPALGKFSYETRSRDNWRVATVMGWKALELGIGWFSGYDDVDMLSLTLLTHIPHAYLLHTFYLIDRFPIILHLTITCLANIVPFVLLRRRHSAHIPIPWSPKDLVDSTAKPYTHDTVLTITISALGCTLYMIPLYSSLATWLPKHLATSFGTLETLLPAHAANIFNVLAGVAPLGFFTHLLLFAPAIHPSAETLYISEAAAEFDPETASLGETFARNVFWWRYLPPRQQEIVRRTTSLVLWTAANVWFLAWGTVQGSEGWGALGWAAVWSAGAALAGSVLGWVAAAA